MKKYSGFDIGLFRPDLPLLYSRFRRLSTSIGAREALIFHNWYRFRNTGVKHVSCPLPGPALKNFFQFFFILFRWISAGSRGCKTAVSPCNHPVNEYNMNIKKPRRGKT
jgi:hypothetical protein